MNPQPQFRYWFAGVRYSDFVGDLVILPHKLYFFGQKVKISKPPDEGKMMGATAGVMGVGGALTSMIAKGGAELDETVRLFERPKLNMRELWRTKATVEELQAALESFVSEAGNYRTVYSEDLPPPRCYCPQDVKNLAVSFTGKLEFDTEYDQHSFRVGLFSAGKVRKALTDCGFTP